MENEGMHILLELEHGEVSDLLVGQECPDDSTVLP